MIETRKDNFFLSSLQKKDKALYQFLQAMTGISLTLSESSDTTEPVLCLLAAGPVSANGSGDHWAMDQWGHGAGSRDQASCTASCTARVHEAVLTIVNMSGEPCIDSVGSHHHEDNNQYHHGHQWREQDLRYISY